MSSVLQHNDIKNLDTKYIGGKARNLHELNSLDVRVPKWCVIPANVPQEFTENLLDELRSFFGNDFEKQQYAVRSSALDEDGTQHSFAGQFESYLHVPFHQMKERVEDVWKSASSERVQNYRKQNKLTEDNRIAVIIQQMIPAEVSGVGFGADPVTGDDDTRVISAVYGLGEGLVSGALDADTFRVKGDTIKQELVRKNEQFVLSDNGHGIAKVPVNRDKVDVPSLSEHQAKELCTCLDRLKQHFGSPQDIEFAYHNNTLYLLQARPITTQPSKDEYILWDNSNIVESYPGITTPLTFTFIIKMYERVYRQFSELLGVEKSVIESHSEVFANTLGLVRGRVYYNLLAWYKMLAMVPGYSLNAAFMENMMGVKERFELKENYTLSKGKAWLRILYMVFNMLRLHLGIKKERKRFMEYLNNIMAKYERYDFDNMTTPEIIEKYKLFESKLLLEWKAPLINDFFAMIWFGLLQKQTEKICPDHPNIHNDLLCGSQDIISVEPIHQSLAISAAILSDDECKQLFLDRTPSEIWQCLQEGKHPEIYQMVKEYIAKFGERCVGELKLETISYNQEPQLFIKIIQGYVKQGITEKRASPSMDVDIRKKAEAIVKEKLNGSPLKKWWFNIVLTKARDFVSHRENLRYERTRGFGMVRKMMSAVGNNLFQNGHIEHARDVFYLELDEILELQHSEVHQEAKSKLLQRKNTFSRYKEQPLPEERFFTYGYDFKDEYIYSTEKLQPIEGDLQGIGCCPGRVKAKVRVIRDPHELDSLEGDILVTSSTDPGWVTLFPTASAIIVERGSLLSHSAIVSREMCIPCIVSVTGLLRTLKTGDRVEMDGATGKIKVLPS